MTVPHITQHAIQRYKERVQDLPAEQIIKALSSPSVKAAIKFGAPYVKLPSKHRVVIQEASVVTVLPKDTPAMFVAQYGKV